MAKQRPSLYRQRRQSTASNLVIVAVVLGVAFFLLVFLAACDDCGLTKLVKTQVAPSPTVAAKIDINLIKLKPICQCEDDTGQPDQTTPADSPPDETDTPAETDEPDDYSYEEHDSQQVSSWPSFWPAITRWITGYGALAADPKCDVALFMCRGDLKVKNAPLKAYYEADYKKKNIYVSLKDDGLAPTLTDQVERFTRDTVHGQPVKMPSTFAIDGAAVVKHQYSDDTFSKTHHYVGYVQARPDTKPAPYYDHEEGGLEMAEYILRKKGSTYKRDSTTFFLVNPKNRLATTVPFQAQSDIIMYELPQVAAEDLVTMRELQDVFWLHGQVHRLIAKKALEDSIEKLNYTIRVGGFTSLAEGQRKIKAEINEGLKAILKERHERDYQFDKCVKDKIKEGKAYDSEDGGSVEPYWHEPIAGVTKIPNPGWVEITTRECAQQVRVDLP